MSYEDDGGARASAARNKLASFLLDHGIRVQESIPNCPPKDRDYLEAIVVALRRQEFELLVRDRYVIFNWGNARFKVPIPSTVFKEIEQRRLERYDLFEMKSQGGNSNFFLALGENTQPTVFRFKRWSRRTDEYETEIE